MSKLKYIVLVMLFVLCLGFISCKKDSDDDNNNNQQTTHTHNYIDGVCSCGDKIVVKYTVKFINQYDDIFHLKIAKHTSIKRNKSPEENFETELMEHWPYVNMLVSPLKEINNDISKENEINPQTSDNIIIYILIGLISFVCLLGTMMCLKRSETK